MADDSNRSPDLPDDLDDAAGDPGVGGDSAGLSPAGRRRRQAILRSAVAAARRRRHRRAAARAAAAAVVLIAAAGVAQLALRQGPAAPDAGRLAVRSGDGGGTEDTGGAPATSLSATQPATRSGSIPTSRSVPTVQATRPAGGVPPTPRVVAGPTRTPATVTITTIKTNPNLLAELAVPRWADGWRRIGTDELLRELGRSGLAGGVVVRDGKPQLWFRVPGGYAGRGAHGG
jgi:hypothetical protein